MKDDLINLIDNIDEIEKKFRHFVPAKGICIPSGDFIYDVGQIEKSKLTIQQSLDRLEVLKKALMQQYFG